MNTDDLVEWLRAQLDEDEQAAREATPGPWRVRNLGRHDQSAIVGPGGGTTPMGLPIGPAIAETYSERGAVDAQHIARHDPDRVLRDVEAKRERLRFVEQILGEPPRPEHGEYKLIRDGAMMACAFRLMRIEVLPYVDRPGYRKEWRP